MRREENDRSSAITELTVLDILLNLRTKKEGKTKPLGQVLVIKESGCSAQSPGLCHWNQSQTEKKNYLGVIP